MPVEPCRRHLLALVILALVVATVMAVGPVRVWALDDDQAGRVDPRRVDLVLPASMVGLGRQAVAVHRSSTRKARDWSPLATMSPSVEVSSGLRANGGVV